MLRRLWMMIRRDDRINLRNHFYTVVVVVAVLYVIAVKWLIPAKLNVEQVGYLVDLTADRRVATALTRSGAMSSLQLLPDAQALRQAARENKSSSGILLTEGKPLPQVTMVFQGHENQRVRNLAAAKVEALLRTVYQQPVPGALTVTVDTLGGARTELPFNKMLLPVLLFTDPALVGLLFIAALIFMEKEEGTLLAYLVSPGRVFEYLLSKAVTMAMLAVLFTLILVLPVLGFDPNWLHLLALMVVSALFSTLLGAFVAVRFENLSQSLFPLITVMTVLTVPAAAYMNPSFSPAWLRYFPTYPMVFGLREALFPAGNPGDVYNALLILLGWTAALLALASAAFRRQVSRAA